jgi:predicted nucleic acid-binding Zn ribbon protein
MGKVKHKMFYTQIYHKWSAMISRCRNEKDPNYRNYGARGISVCEKWKDFMSFYKDMGDVPFENAQLDRIDNDGNYCPENCQWILPKENSRNRRTTKRHKTSIGTLVQVELMEKIGWNKNQFTWFKKKHGISWILDGFKNGTLPKRTNQSVDRNKIINSVFGKWVVLKFHSYKRGEGNRYICRCECGVEKEVVGYYLRSGKSKGCRKCAYKNQKIKPNPKKCL